MFDLPDAPDIARTMRTGYPYTNEKHICPHCGENIVTHYGATYGEICKSCALDTWDELTDKEKLDILGFEEL